MRIAVLFLVAMVVAPVRLVALEGAPAEGNGASSPIPEACSPEFWRRAITVATGHGRGSEFEARQIGRVRCDCTVTQSQSRSCRGSVVPEDEAVSTDTEE
jgi:hypothetical protein